MNVAGITLYLLSGLYIVSPALARDVATDRFGNLIQVNDSSYLSVNNNSLLEGPISSVRLQSLITNKPYENYDVFFFRVGVEYDKAPCRVLMIASYGKFQYKYKVMPDSVSCDSWTERDGLWGANTGNTKSDAETIIPIKVWDKVRIGSDLMNPTLKSGEVLSIIGLSYGLYIIAPLCSDDESEGHKVQAGAKKFAQGIESPLLEAFPALKQNLSTLYSEVSSSIKNKVIGEKYSPQKLCYELGSAMEKWSNENVLSKIDLPSAPSKKPW